MKMKNLISVQEAQSNILNSVKPGEPEMIPIEQALSRVLAASITSGMDIPAANLSSMDGYAVDSHDTLAASSDTLVSLDVVAEIFAGISPEFVLQPGQAARIMTGAVVPEGADAVVPFEEIVAPGPTHYPINGEKIHLTKPSVQGSNVRPRGQDVRMGSTLLEEHHILQPQDIGLLAMTGHSHIEVMSKPSVGILSTGDELVLPGNPLAPGKIYESNSYMLAALVEKFGGRAVLSAKAMDNPEKIEYAINELVNKKVNFILTTGGVSAGKRDYVREVISKSGRNVFWKVNIRPGKPLMFGEYAAVPIFGLPGNPVSSYVSFLVFVLPAIRKKLGVSPLERKTLKAILEDPVESDGRESYLRGILHHKNGQYYARLTSHQGSGNLYSLVNANTLLILPSGVKSLPTGTEVDAWLLE